MRKNVFITGGAGFVGRWLVDRCLKEGLKVTVYDNLFAGKKKNVEEFMDKIKFIEADIIDQEKLKKSMQEAKPDIVFHLAAYHFIPYCNEHQRETMNVNVNGTFLVLKTAQECGVKTIITISSGVIYPGQERLLKESDDIEILDIYGLTKAMGERIAEYFANNSSMACFAIRLFNTYGPYENNPHLIPHIIESLKKGNAVELGNIYTKRDYIYVEDVADMIYQCSNIRNNKFMVINVGTGNEYSAKEIVNKISKLLNKEIEIKIEQNRVRKMDKMHQAADISRLKEVTNYEPKYNIDNGLKKLLFYEGLIKNNII